MRMCRTQVPISTYHVHTAACSDDIKLLTSAVIATVVTVCMANDFYLNDATKLHHLRDETETVYKDYVTWLNPHTPL